MLVDLNGFAVSLPRTVVDGGRIWTIYRDNKPVGTIYQNAAYGPARWSWHSAGLWGYDAHDLVKA